MKRIEQVPSRKLTDPTLGKRKKNLEKYQKVGDMSVPQCDFGYSQKGQEKTDVQMS